ncbi:hypothetical protein D3C74_295230 [compost metagenome]
MRFSFGIPAFPPKGRAVIAVENHLAPLPLDRFGERFHVRPHAVVHRQRNPAEMDRIDPGGDFREIVGSFRRGVKAAVQPVRVCHATRPHAKAVLQEVHANVHASPQDARGIDTQFAQVGRSGASKRIVRQPRNQRTGMPVTGQGRCDVDAGARKGIFQRIALRQRFVTRHLQAHHDFAEGCYAFRHKHPPAFS